MELFHTFVLVTGYAGVMMSLCQEYWARKSGYGFSSNFKQALLQHHNGRKEKKKESEEGRRRENDVEMV